MQVYNKPKVNCIYVSCHLVKHSGPTLFLSDNSAHLVNKGSCDIFSVSTGALDHSATVLPKDQKCVFE